MTLQVLIFQLRKSKFNLLNFFMTDRNIVIVVKTVLKIHSVVILGFIYPRQSLKSQPAVASTFMFLFKICNHGCRVSFSLRFQFILLIAHDVSALRLIEKDKISNHLLTLVQQIISLSHAMRPGLQSAIFGWQNY